VVNRRLSRDWEHGPARNKYQVQPGTNVQGGRHMPQSNNAELTKLYTSETGVDAQNNEPNSDGPAATYNLRLEAVAGDPLGDSGANYTLQIDCIDENLAQRNAQLSVGTVPQAFDGGSGWQKVGDDFKTEQTFLINVPAGVQGHMFRYVATMVSDNNDVISFIESNKFVLVDP
jgi:hypothetical protein